MARVRDLVAGCEMRVMGEYQLYLKDGDGHHVSSFHFAAKDDLSAQEAAQHFRGRSGAELWRGLERLVEWTCDAPGAATPPVSVPVIEEQLDDACIASQIAALRARRSRNGNRQRGARSGWVRRAAARGDAEAAAAPGGLVDLWRSPWSSGD